MDIPTWLASILGSDAFAQLCGQRAVMRGAGTGLWIVHIEAGGEDRAAHPAAPISSRPIIRTRSRRYRAGRCRPLPMLRWYTSDRLHLTS